MEGEGRGGGRGRERRQKRVAHIGLWVQFPGQPFPSQMESSLGIEGPKYCDTMGTGYYKDRELGSNSDEEKEKGRTRQP